MKKSIQELKLERKIKEIEDKYNSFGSKKNKILREKKKVSNHQESRTKKEPEKYSKLESYNDVRSGSHHRKHTDSEIFYPIKYDYSTEDFVTSHYEVPDDIILAKSDDMDYYNSKYDDKYDNQYDNESHNIYHDKKNSSCECNEEKEDHVNVCTKGCAAIIVKSRNPIHGEGCNGDIFINISTGDYFKKKYGTWILKGNLIGPQGPQGIQGPQGLPGDIVILNNSIDFAISAGTINIPAGGGFISWFVPSDVRFDRANGANNAGNVGVDNFTVPVDGIYRFDFFANIPFSSEQDTILFNLGVPGNSDILVQSFNINIPFNGPSISGNLPVSISGYLKLTTGEQVKIEVVSNETVNLNLVNFAGSLIDTI